MKLTAVFPSASCAVTWTDGVIVAPEPVLVGCVLKTRWVAAPAVMLKAELVMLRAPDAAASRYPTPTLSMLRSLNVATPPTAATFVMPASAPPPGLTPIVMVTVSVKLGTVFPAASCAATTTAGAMITPAGVDAGCTVNTKRETGPMRMSNVLLVAPTNPVAAAVRV